MKFKQKPKADQDENFQFNHSPSSQDIAEGKERSSKEVLSTSGKVDKRKILNNSKEATNCDMVQKIEGSEIFTINDDETFGEKSFFQDPASNKNQNADKDEVIESLATISLNKMPRPVYFSFQVNNSLVHFGV